MAQNPLIQTLLQAQAAFEGVLLSKQNVVGVAVGYKESSGVLTDQLAVIALVAEKKPEANLSSSDLVPKQVNGVRTDVYEVGYLRAQSSVNPRERFRPVFSGVSMGHTRITAGTLGVVVYDRTTGDKLLLSNNHVFANNNEGQVGDAILQPGVLDGGQSPADMVARLERFVPLRFIEDAIEQPPTPTPDPINPPKQPVPIEDPIPERKGCSPVGAAATAFNALAAMAGSKERLVSTPVSAQSAGKIATAAVPQTVKAQAATPDNATDAALARPINPNEFNEDILGIGKINGTKSAALGQAVRKMGRTSGLTQGTVTLLNATITIGYNTSRGERTARFTGQILTTSMSQGGDSGSLLVDQFENRAIGLLFAGSPQASVFTPIDVVLAALNVTL